MAIEKLVLRNFQCHKDLEIRFDPGITTIVGPSDSGKTAVLRALRWLAFNRPLGESFKRIGADHCEVILEVDGQKIIRQKGRSNTYCLNDCTFSAFGTSVPDAVVSLLRMDEKNFQGQHDAPFWFDLTPSSLASELNALVELDVIDRALDYLGSEQRKLKIKLELVEQRLNEAEEQKKKLFWLPDLEQRFKKLEDLQTRKMELDSKVSDLRKKILAIRTALVESRILARLLDLWEDRGIPLANHIQQWYKQRQYADQLIPLLGRLKKERLNHRRYHDLWEYWNANGIRLQGYGKRVQALRQRTANLKKLLKEIENVKRVYEDSKQSESVAMERLKDYTGGTCPVCGGPL